MSKRMILILAALMIPSLAVTPCARAQDDDAAKKEETATKTVKDPIGYFLGISLGQNLRQSGFRTEDFQIEALMSGFQDGMSDNEVALTDEQLAETQSKITAMLQTRQGEMLQAQKAKGEKFLVENAEKEGVKSLEGGVQYKVLKAGEGESPTETDTVTVHYTGKLINGQVFDSSVKRGEPATFRINQVIKGWQMALQEMRVGDKWMLYIPSDLAYGAQGSQGAIGPHEVLVFEVELLSIQ